MLVLTALAVCLAGLVGLVLGAEFVTRGESALAARLGIPPIVIGLTVVAIGTSTPELAVGVDAASQGNGGLAVGNVAGANIINLLLVLGLSAMLQPIPLRLQTIRLELPATVAASFGLIGVAADGRLSVADGGVLLTAAAGYTALVVWLALGESRTARAQFAREFALAKDDRRAALREVAWDLAVLAAGITVILVAADWFVDGAVRLARLWQVSEAFIGLTVVALGTTSPELATTIMSTAKKQRDIGLGNLLGSCVYNVLLILGAACVASGSGIPMSRELLRLDLPVMALAALVCMPVFLSGHRVSRGEGGLLVAAYAVLVGYLITTRT